MSVVPDYLRRQVVEGEREPDLLVPLDDCCASSTPSRNR